MSQTRSCRGNDTEQGKDSDPWTMQLYEEGVGGEGGGEVEGLEPNVVLRV